MFSLCCCTVFRPISADAKLRMNPRSDVDFSSPKVDLTVNLSEVAFELNRPQVGACVCEGKCCLIPGAQKWRLLKRQLGGDEAAE